MTFGKNDDFNDRVGRAADAKKKALDALKARPKIDPAVQAERVAAHAERQAAEAAARAERKAAKAAAAEAAKAEAEAKIAAEPTEADRKAARDARYAARKNRK